MRNIVLILALSFVSTCALSCESSSQAALPVGAIVENFALPTHDGKQVSLKDYRGSIVVLEWFNRGCPFVEKHYKAGAMPDIQAEYGEKGVVWLIINSTRTDHDNYLSPEETAQVISDWKIRGAAMLNDSSGQVGRRFGAKTTPHMFVIDKDGKLAYQGAIDDDSSVFSDPKKAKNYVRAALDELLDGKPVTVAQSKPYGCSVKYAE